MAWRQGGQYYLMACVWPVGRESRFKIQDPGSRLQGPGSTSHECVSASCVLPAAAATAAAATAVRRCGGAAVR
eukprot:9853078-Alexandrium_andersonii.AAC.1